MILIADSGSTKTQWKLTGGGHEQKEIISEGINPYLQHEKQIFESLIKVFADKEWKKEVTQVFFYGAGCGAPENKKLLAHILLQIFPAAISEVHTDLLGAARAACGRREGIAAILGTGSNSCYYDGNNIQQNMPSLGFILGDEGSGSYIGKRLVGDILNLEAPEDMITHFHNHLKLSKEEIINKVYKQPYPNRFLASFVPFLSPYRNHEYVHRLLFSAFDAFFDKHICKYERHASLPLSCIGSIAFHFKEILQEVCDRKKVLLERVIEKPLNGIVRFHLENISEENGG